MFPLLSPPVPIPPMQMGTGTHSRRSDPGRWETLTLECEIVNHNPVLVLLVEKKAMKNT